MAASRSVHKGAYKSDILGPGTIFSRRTDDHFFTQAPLGWGINALPGGVLPLPGTLRPRHAVGLDSSGRRHSVVVADVTADVWTRTAAGWNILDDTGALDAVTTTGLVGEAVTF
jgi:hypothetical protein